MKTFVPHPQCTVPSGDCFVEARCLNQCKAQARKDCAKAIEDLRGRLLNLEKVVYGAGLHRQQGGRSDGQ